jgi:hypothetical protein
MTIGIKYANYQIMTTVLGSTSKPYKTINDRHLLACAIASEFTVTWQYSQREQLLFFVTDQTTHPYPTKSLPAQF